MKKLGISVLSAVVLLILGSAASYAHSLLERTVPSAGASVHGPVTSVVLQFENPVEEGFATLALIKDGAAVESKTEIDLSANRKTLTFKGLSLDAGAWVVRWSAVSADGHRVKGDIAFTVVNH